MQRFVGRSENRKVSNTEVYIIIVIHVAILAPVIIGLICPCEKSESESSFPNLLHKVLERL